MVEAAGSIPASSTSFRSQLAEFTEKKFGKGNHISQR